MIFKDWFGNPHKLPPGRTFGWRPSVYGLVLNEGKILLIKSKLSGKWAVPGGGLDLGEKIEKAVLREVEEETGCRIRLHEQPLLVDSEYFYAIDTDKYWQSLRIVFRAELIKDSGKIKDTYEVEECGWQDIVAAENLDIDTITRDALGLFKKNYLKSS
jgi:8-oxo-dGTP pyrophosphatase MutT (NUDIX family)